MTPLARLCFRGRPRSSRLSCVGSHAFGAVTHTGPIEWRYTLRASGVCGGEVTRTVRVFSTKEPQLRIETIQVTAVAADGGSCDRDGRAQADCRTRAHSPWTRRLGRQHRPERHRVHPDVPQWRVVRMDRRDTSGRAAHAGDTGYLDHRHRIALVQRDGRDTEFHASVGLGKRDSEVSCRSAGQRIRCGRLVWRCVADGQEELTQPHLHASAHIAVPLRESQLEWRRRPVNGGVREHDPRAPSRCSQHPPRALHRRRESPSRAERRKADDEVDVAPERRRMLDDFDDLHNCDFWEELDGMARIGLPRRRRSNLGTHPRRRPAWRSGRHPEQRLLHAAQQRPVRGT